jgi:hypothetical protein
VDAVLAREGDQMLADRMLCAMWTDFGAWLAKNPDAGCHPREK